MLQFKKEYFILFILLLFTEIVIAKYASGFVRHTLGDYLVVFLLYSFIRSFTKLSINKTALLVLAIAFGIELLQLTNLQNYYPNKYVHTLKTLLGTSFSFADIVAYTLGVLTILFLEHFMHKKVNSLP